jgi:hypothetical protein
MALTGHLSDLSLSELLEFFCNQRKSGRLKVLYPKGAGYFFLQAGSVVDARIGALHGIEAVFYALTLPNAEFEFSAEAESVNRTINQPWTQVVLEGLRRLDEGIAPGLAFPEGFVPEPDEFEVAANKNESATEVHRSFGPTFFSFVGGKESSRRKPLFIGAIAVAVLASVAVIGVPAGWYGKQKTVAPAETATSAPAQPSAPQATAPQPEPEASSQSEDAATLAARKQRERDRARAREARAAAGETPPVASAPSGETSKPGAKKVVVTVTYDESGRVTQASGGDPTALRIARQKRFPVGKAGSAKVTIPIN